MMIINASIEDEDLFRSGNEALKSPSGGSTSTIVSAWERRAMELSTRRRYAPTDTMHWHSSTDGTSRYLVLADTSGIHHYDVTIHPETDRRHTCDCPAGSHGRPCKHVGIALQLWQQFDRPVWAEQERGAIA